MFENQGGLTAVKSAVITITTRKALGAFNLVVVAYYSVCGSQEKTLSPSTPDEEHDLMRQCFDHSKTQLCDL